MSRHTGIRSLAREAMEDLEDEYGWEEEEYDYYHPDDPNYIPEEGEEGEFGYYDEDGVFILSHGGSGVPPQEQEGRIAQVMGTLGESFSRDDVIYALESTDFTPDKAVEFLLSGQAHPAQAPLMEEKPQQPQEDPVPVFDFKEPSPDRKALAAREKGVRQDQQEHNLRGRGEKNHKGSGEKGGKLSQNSVDVVEEVMSGVEISKSSRSTKSENATSEVTFSYRSPAAEAGPSSAPFQGRERDKKPPRKNRNSGATDSSMGTFDEEVDALVQGSEGSKPKLNMVVVGHVDAGKSTLMGHLLFKMGAVDPRAMHKFRKESSEMGKASFAYAWVLDESGEERSRGVTVDVAVRHFETPHRSITLLDAPGHRDFIPNMISGATQAEAAILVIDCKDFESGFFNGSTKEHAMLVRSLGVTQLIVAINKMDMADWSQELFNYLRDQLATFLRTLGFKESSLFYVPVSGLSGDNLVDRCTSLSAAWYIGGTLLELIDMLEPPVRLPYQPLRILVSDVYQSQSTGVSVAGKVEAGSVRVKQKVLVVPIQEKCTVQVIDRHGERASLAVAGDNLELGLRGIDLEKLSIGSVLCDPRHPVRVCRKFRAQILTFELNVPLLQGSQVVLHTQAINVPASITRLRAIIDKTGKQGAKPRAIPQNTAAVVDLQVEKPICLEPYSSCRALGRIMLRAGNKTVAAGMVLKLKKPHRNLLSVGPSSLSSSLSNVCSSSGSLSLGSSSRLK